MNVSEFISRKMREQKAYELRTKGVSTPDIASRLDMSEAEVTAAVEAIITREELLASIMTEMERVFGPSAETDDYDWLLENYGISEDDDVRLVFIGNLSLGEYYVFEEFEEDDEHLEFLNDNSTINKHLQSLLRRYQSNTLTYS